MKTAGSVVLQEYGCGFSTLLVLAGPPAGTVWWDGRATCDRIVPLSLDHVDGARPIHFGEWLRHGSWALLPPDWGPRHPPVPLMPGQPAPGDNLSTGVLTTGATAWKRALKNAPRTASCAPRCPHSAPGSRGQRGP
ncbi:hypothetical protein GCM10009540_55710 [Streptomyces turgidiscabies]